MTLGHGLCVVDLVIVGQALAIVVAVVLWDYCKRDVPCRTCDGVGFLVRSGFGWMKFNECWACRGTGVRGR